MKSILLVVLLASNAQAQDLALVDIMSPTTRCALTPSETVTIAYQNLGATLPAGTKFEAAYRVSDTKVTETVTLDEPLAKGESRLYTFAKKPVLNAADVYVFDLSVAIKGDRNPANDAVHGYALENNAPSYGGRAIHSGGLITVVDQVGVLELWERSLDNGATWEHVSKSSVIDPSLALAARYRARVRNGVCPPAVSTEFVR